jgi:hypothetical protein
VVVMETKPRTQLHDVSLSVTAVFFTAKYSGANSRKPLGFVEYHSVTCEARKKEMRNRAAAYRLPPVARRL